MIKNIKRVRPEKFTLPDTLIISAGLMILLDFGLAKLRQYSAGISLNEAILQLSNIWMLIFTLAGLAFFTLLFLRDAFEIEIEQEQDSDRIISFIIQHFGLKQAAKKEGVLIFKPALSQRMFWLNQKIGITVKGNFVSVSGSWLFLRKLKKVLKSY